MFTQDDLQKVYQVRQMLELHTSQIVEVAIQNDNAVFKWYLTEGGKPYLENRVHQHTVENMDWSMLTMLLLNSRH